MGLQRGRGGGARVAAGGGRARRSRGGWLLAAWWPCLLLACSADPPRNLVLISLDTLVPGRMSAYGNERKTTPRIDGILRDAVRFTRAYSPAPWTLPAHAAMLTGFYPSTLAPDPNDRRLYKIAPLLSSRFREKGYRTAAFTGGSYVSRVFGVDRDFEFYVEAENPAAKDGREVEIAANWIEENASDPFFLFFHTYYAHMPYKDPRFLEGRQGGRLAERYRKNHLFGVLGHSDLLHCPGIVPTPEERGFLLALYDGGVAGADEMVGGILDALSRAGVLDRTTVIITGDHGEEFWEHTGRAAYHGHSLYDELLRVPLIWYEPGLPAAGTARDEPVSLIDIVPTVASRFGLSVREALDGVDLSPMLEGEDWRVNRALFAEAAVRGPSRRSVRTQEGKLIVTGGPQQGEGRKCPVRVLAPRELYLPGDEAERDNRFEEEPQLAKALLELLDRRSESVRPPAPEGDRIEVDEALRERLRALGYEEP